MNTRPLTLFTVPALTARLPRPLLGRLLFRLNSDLPERCRLANPEALESHGSHQFSVEMLHHPHDLPEPFLLALDQIEALAAPQLHPDLAHRTDLLPDDLQLALLERAIILWLHAPNPPASTPPVSSTDNAAQKSSDPHPAAPPANLAPPLPPTAVPGSAFTDPDFLAQLDPDFLHDLFQYFSSDFRALDIETPDFLLPDTEYCRAAAKLLLNPASLPERLREILPALEELASPKNRQLLRGLLAPCGIRGEPLDPPLKLALEYYLRCPFAADGLADLPSRLTRAPAPALRRRPPSSEDSAETSAPPASSGEPQPQPRRIPGDLAAIARFPRNKISRLPAETRESINQMLRRRVPYRQILTDLGEAGQTLNKNNLFRWKKTGYLVWLHEQQKREEAQAQLELLLDLVRENDNGTIHEAAQQLAALKICYALADLDLATLKQSLQQDPAAFLRLVQALPRLSHGGMHCEQIRLAVAERKVQLEKDKLPKSQRVISPETLKKIEEQLKLM